MGNGSNRSTNAEVERVKRQSLPSWDMVLGRWLARMTDHYRQSTSPISVDVYRELLSDLSAAELDAACREAMRTSEYMPTVATIRNAWRSLQAIDPPSTRTLYAEVDPSERIPTPGEQKQIDDLKRKLGILANGKSIEGSQSFKNSGSKKRTAPFYTPRSTPKPIAEQKAELRRRGYKV